MIFAPIAAIGAVAIVASAYLMGFEHGSAEHEAAAQRNALERAKQTVERQAQDIVESEAARRAGDEKIELLVTESDARMASIQQAHDEAIRRHADRADAVTAACQASEEGQFCEWTCTLPVLPETDSKVSQK